ncbi:MAG: GIY-YIG nuclease family protein [Hyphomonas sp.]|nr:GIY-YIG nuclease family protein [Hyphomonas sp.]
MSYACVYMLASGRNGTLYTGVTSNLETRIWQHKHDVLPGFSRKYGCRILVWFECHDDIHEAILREKRLKRWRRSWKLDLIEKDNPQWRDLYPQLLSVPAESVLQDSPLLGPG